MEKREVTYSLTKQEFIKLSLAQTVRNRRGVIMLVVFILLLIICAMDHVWYVSLLYVILLPILLYYRLNRHYDKRLGKKPMTISISPEGLGVSGEGLNSTIAWKYAKSCKDTQKYIFFRLQHAHSVFAIPRRAFSSEVEARAFFNDLQTYICK